MSLNYDELNNLLVEEESLINSWPLTYNYDDEESILTSSDAVPFDQWSKDPFYAKLWALWNNEHSQYTNEKTTTSQAVASRILKAAETRVYLISLW